MRLPEPVLVVPKELDGVVDPSETGIAVDVVVWEWVALSW